MNTRYSHRVSFFIGLLALIFIDLAKAQAPFVLPGKATDLNKSKLSEKYDNLKGELTNFNYEIQTSSPKRRTLDEDGFIQQGFFSSVSYSLISPSFDSEKLTKQNQESLGVTVSGGYVYAPYSGWGIGMGLGVFQNSKTDRSLPDFVALKPYSQLIFSLNNQFYLSSGIFVLNWQDEKFKNFISYIGSDYQLGYKVNKKLNIRFGFSYIKIFGEFKDSTDVVTQSLVSIKGIESQLIYIF